MTQPQDPFQPPQPAAAPPPPPPPYGAPAPPAYGAPAYGAPPPPAYGAPAYGGYGPPPGQRVNDPAPMGMRLLARIIDGILVFVIVGIVISAAGIHVFHTSSANGTSSASFSLYGGDYLKAVLIGLLITGAYEVGMIATRGATLGKMAVGVRVANLENGQTPSFGQAVIRWAIPSVAGAIFGLLQLIIVLSPFFDSTHRNRGWYDYAAKTIAVRSR